MVKKSKVGLTIGIITLVFVVLIVAIFLLYKGGVLQTGVTSGGLVLSMSQNAFTSNDPTIGGSAWLVNIVDNGQSQSVYGSLSKSQITDGTRQATNDLQVTIQHNPQVCSYVIQNQNQVIQNMQLINKGTYFLQSSCTNDCSPDSSFLFKQAYSFTLNTCYCFHKTTTATVGSLLAPSLQFTNNIIAIISGTQYQGTISNTGSQSISLGDGSVQATWAGNLVSGEQCPISSSSGVQAVFYNGNWQTTSQSSYNQYSIYDIGGFQTCVISAQSSNDITTCVQQYNNYANTAIGRIPFSATGGETAIQTGTQSGGTSTITLGQLIQFPLITMRIKASTLGVYIPVTQPKIVGSNSTCFQTGSANSAGNGFINVQVQNQGTVAGSITTSLSCTAGFSSGNSITQQFQAGQTQTIYLPITGQTSQQQATGSCTISVNDASNPSNKDSATVNTCVQGLIICNKGDTRCNGVNKEICTQGTGWDLQTANAQDCQNQLPGNTTPPVGGGSCSLIWYNPVSWFTSLWCQITALVSSVVDIVIGVLAIIFLLFTAVSFSTADFTKKLIKNTALRIITGIVLGILVAVAIEMLKWIIVIAMVVIFIVYAIIKWVL